MARNSRRPMTSMFEQAVGAQKEEELDRLRAEIEQLKLTQTNGSGEPGFIQIPVAQIVALRPDAISTPKSWPSCETLSKNTARSWSQFWYAEPPMAFTKPSVENGAGAVAKNSGSISSQLW